MLIQEFYVNKNMLFVQWVDTCTGTNYFSCLSPPYWQPIWFINFSLFPLHTFSPPLAVLSSIIRSCYTKWTNNLGPIDTVSSFGPLTIHNVHGSLAVSFRQRQLFQLLTSVHVLSWSNRKTELLSSAYHDQHNLHVLWLQSQ